MKLIKKILIGLIVMVLLLIAYVQIGSWKNFTAPYPDITASKDPKIIARGKYLAFGPALCSSCHVPKDKVLEVENGLKMPLSGGWELEIDPAIIRSANLTPDTETGIGQYTDQEIARAIRYGVSHDNRLMMNVGMPYPEMNDEDLTAIISYLRSQPAVFNKVKPSKYKFLGKALIAFGALKPQFNEMIPSDRIEKVVTIKYGEYLVKSISNCMICHSNIDPASGEYINPPFSGGFVFPPDSFSGGYVYVSPNITPHKETGVMASWSESKFINRIKSGRIDKGSPMPWGAISRMDTTDLKAVYMFLQSLDPIENEVTSTMYIPGKK